MKTQADYNKLLDDIAAVERRIAAIVGEHAYLSDRNVDAQNVELPESDPNYWTEMYCAAASAAGFRAEEYCVDLNKELGYIVY